MRNFIVTLTAFLLFTLGNVYPSLAEGSNGGSNTEQTQVTKDVLIDELWSLYNTGSRLMERVYATSGEGRSLTSSTKDEINAYAVYVQQWLKNNMQHGHLTFSPELEEIILRVKLFTLTLRMLSNPVEKEILAGIRPAIPPQTFVLVVFFDY